MNKVGVTVSLATRTFVNKACHGEGNGNPLQYPCLENPMDRSLVGYNPWGRKELDTTEYLSMLGKDH